MSLTKKAISAAFLDLTKSKNIDKITVKDIVGICNITRQTFYYHFQDIMDVIEWSMEQRMEALLEESLKAKSMEESIKILFSIAKEQPDIINKLMGSQKRELTEKLLFNTMRTYMQEMIDRKELFMDMKRNDVAMTLDFYSYAIIGILLDINSKRKAVDLDLISKQIYLLVTGKMFQN